MFHYVNSVTNDKGDALKGYFVRARRDHRFGRFGNSAMSQRNIAKQVLLEAEPNLPFAQPEIA